MGREADEPTDEKAASDEGESYTHRKIKRPLRGGHIASRVAVFLYNSEGQI